MKSLRRKLGIAVVAFLSVTLLSDSGAQTVPIDGLVSRWLGDGDATDSVGTIDGSATPGLGYTAGVFGDAFLFDAAAQRISVPPAASLYPQSSFSLDAWIQTSGPVTTSPGITNLYECGGSCGTGDGSFYGIRLTNTGQPEVGVRGPAEGTPFPNSNVAVGPTPVDDGQFHHLALVRDSLAGELYLYVDGILEGTDTLLSANNLPLKNNDGEIDPFIIGGWRESGTGNPVGDFPGIVDDVKFYSRALSPDEVANIAGEGVPVVPRVLNIDAAMFGDPPVAGIPAGDLP